MCIGFAILMVNAIFAKPIISSGSGLHKSRLSGNF